MEVRKVQNIGILNTKCPIPEESSINLNQKSSKDKEIENEKMDSVEINDKPDYPLTDGNERNDEIIAIID